MHSHVGWMAWGFQRSLEFFTKTRFRQQTQDERLSVESMVLSPNATSQLWARISFDDMRLRSRFSGLLSNTLAVARSLGPFISEAIPIVTSVAQYPFSWLHSHPRTDKRRAWKHRKVLLLRQWRRVVIKLRVMKVCIYAQNLTQSSSLVELFRRVGLGRPQLLIHELQSCGIHTFQNVTMSDLVAFCQAARMYSGGKRGLVHAFECYHNREYALRYHLPRSPSFERPSTKSVAHLLQDSGVTLSSRQSCLVGDLKISMPILSFDIQKCRIGIAKVVTMPSRGMLASLTDMVWGVRIVNLELHSASTMQRFYVRAAYDQKLWQIDLKSGQSSWVNAQDVCVYSCLVQRDGEACVITRKTRTKLNQQLVNVHVGGSRTFFIDGFLAQA